jgi:hypothetical protein
MPLPRLKPPLSCMVLISKNFDADESSTDCCLLLLTFGLLESAVCDIEIIGFPLSVSMWSAIYLTVLWNIAEVVKLLIFYDRIMIKVHML